MGIFDAIGIDAGIVLIIVILIQLVLIFFLVKQSMKLARLTNKYKMFMRGKDAISLEKAFEKKFEEVDAMTEAVKYQADEIYKLKEIQKMTLNKTAIVKYDAFKDVGGKLSFALAMLDKENSGFVLNAIHSREGSYTYVKEIVKRRVLYRAWRRRKRSTASGCKCTQRYRITSGIKTESVCTEGHKVTLRGRLHVLKSEKK